MDQYAESYINNLYPPKIIFIPSEDAMRRLIRKASTVASVDDLNLA